MFSPHEIHDYKECLRITRKEIEAYHKKWKGYKSKIKLSNYNEISLYKRYKRSGKNSNGGGMRRSNNALKINSKKT